eukprot:Platyproteum_vivax@DN5945_c0_g1_i3.p1
MAVALKHSKFQDYKKSFHRQTWPIQLFQAKGVSILFLFLCVIFVIVGVIILVFARKAYDTEIVFYQTGDVSVNINVERDLIAPITVYYYLSNFNGNHKRFQTSRPRKYFGSSYSCSGATTIGKAKELRPDFQNLASFPDEVEVEPCGLGSWAFFSDRFEIFDPYGQQVEIEEDHLAWPWDKKLFAEDGENCEKMKESGQCSTQAGLDATIHTQSDLKYCKYWTCPGVNSRYQAWMRANISHIQKNVLGVMRKGQYVLYLTQNSWPAELWNTEKGVTLGTTTHQGGSNSFVGWLCIAQAIILFLGSLSLLIPLKLHFFKPGPYVLELQLDVQTPVSVHSYAQVVPTSTRPAQTSARQPVASTLVGWEHDAREDATNLPSFHDEYKQA